MKLLLVNVDGIEEPPPSKRVRTMEDKGVEQLQPTALYSEETITTGEAAQEHVLWYTCTCVYSCTLITYPHTCVPLTNYDQLGVCGYVFLTNFMWRSHALCNVSTHTLHEWE